MTNLRTTTILDRLDRHAREAPNRVAYTFLRDEWPVEPAAIDTLTFGELAGRVDALAAHLLDNAQPGDRAVLLYPSSLEFVVAFLACLRAGVIAVPANVPSKEKHFGRLAGILEDCEPRLTLTTAEIAGLIGAMSLDDIDLGQVVATDGAFTAAEAKCQGDETSPLFPALQPADIAFLQYTSGSTAEPKGVIVTHANLMANEAAIEQGAGHSKDSVHVGWLPLFHDMGLVGNVLQPLFVGYRSVLLTPQSFLRQPVRWLQAISEFRGTTSGGPNFAYEHCLRLVSDEQKQGLDLSTWQVAFVGAEPVRAVTLDRFYEAFRNQGFRRESWFPCYGLAECTLIASGGPPLQSPTIAQLVAEDLERGSVTVASPSEEKQRPIVGCGAPSLGMEVRVVDPETQRECLPGQVGMIWLHGPSVAAGYWRRPDETQAVFAARLADTGEGPFLQTGDLGFVQDARVFITGRLKDLVIINGRNIYPQDVEAVATEAHALCVGAAACFAIDSELGEGLVVLQEAAVAQDSEEAADVCLHIRRAIARQLDIMPSAVELVSLRSLARTTSGKLRRRGIKTIWLQRRRDVLASETST